MMMSSTVPSTYDRSSPPKLPPITQIIPGIDTLPRLPLPSVRRDGPFQYRPQLYMRSLPRTGSVSPNPPPQPSTIAAWLPSPLTSPSQPGADAPVLVPPVALEPLPPDQFHQLAMDTARGFAVIPHADPHLVSLAQHDLNRFYHQVCDMVPDTDGVDIVARTRAMLTPIVLTHYFSLSQACAVSGVKPPPIPFKHTPRMFAIFTPAHLEAMRHTDASPESAQALARDPSFHPISWQAILHQFAALDRRRESSPAVPSHEQTVSVSPKATKIRRFSCPYYNSARKCSRFGSFSREKLLKSHLRQVHTSSRNADTGAIRCRECQVTFESHSQFYRHCQRCARPN
ncbi:hypothetical protein DIURU_005243 [Diutina rugosa]|uniref:Uncharacterized protein n=1 Tax=Diutina rugosa TaxID=5481 RepID=A0A642UHX1_DIURU|nr:uncharacterized protein DIURU_005243 [Diutina rugosa]KAA8897266.1 hypothetical protein DIURU_005243 [Diutina rugosa]